jgi:hypothetical protein
MSEMNKDLKLSEYLKQIDMTIEEQLKEIPDEILNMLMDRAYTDATKIFKEGKNEDFKQMTYVIYRSYILGMLVEKAKNDSKKKRFIKEENNVIRLIK